MKTSEGIFHDNDINIVSKWVPDLSKMVVNLEEDRKEDVPAIARSNAFIGSILFSDIRGFSQIASRISLGATVTLLNEYYSRILPYSLKR